MMACFHCGAVLEPQAWTPVFCPSCEAEYQADWGRLSDEELDGLEAALPEAAE